LAEHGKPLVFGKDKTQGLRLRHNALELEVVRIGEGGMTEDEVLVHDEKNQALASLLASLHPPHFPEVIGVLYCDPAPSYEHEVLEQTRAAQEAGADLATVIRSGRTWTV